MTLSFSESASTSQLATHPNTHKQAGGQSGHTAMAESNDYGGKNVHFIP